MGIRSWLADYWPVAALSGGFAAALIGVFFHVAWVEANDPMNACILYKQVLIGDKMEYNVALKMMMNYHYYNSTYICDGQFMSRIERV